MKYIITGGAGFIGSWLAEELINKGEVVLAIDNLSTGSVENLSNIIHNQNFKFIKGDAGAFETWVGLLAPNDIIIHLSATVGVIKVCDDPLETISNNSKATEIILKQAVKHKCKVFLASSSEVYGNAICNKSSEDDSAQVLLNNPGRSSYVLGKLISENYCLSYYQKYNLPVIIARFFNVIGPRQVSQYGMVVPTFLMQAVSNSPITIFDDGEQQRTFCDVKDIIRGILMLIENDNAIGEIFNLGGNEPISMSTLAGFIKQASNSKSAIKYLSFPTERSHGNDIRKRTPCLKKINSIIGWHPVIKWQDSIIGTLAEMHLNEDPYKMLR
jgi:UDP-glucose 4-epimerase